MYVVFIAYLHDVVFIAYLLTLLNLLFATHSTKTDTVGARSLEICITYIYNMWIDILYKKNKVHIIKIRYTS